MAKAVFEVDLDGDSILVWEAGTGHRVIFPVPSMAEPVAKWLNDKAREFHEAKDSGRQVAVIYTYGQDHTPYSFIRHFLSLAKSFGYEVREGCETRPPSEFW